MPEGPEIRFVSELIKVRVLNSILQDLKILNGPYLTSSSKIYSTQRDKVNFLEGLKCLDVFSKGKYMFFEFEEGKYLAIHAGMSGSWADKKNKHTLFHLNFEDDDLYFQDLRRFSKIFILMNESEFNIFLNKIGPDIFHIDFTLFKKQLLRMKNSPLHIALMNQNKISGIGNYLRADIMYVAKISPHRLIKNLEDNEIYTLFTACKNVVENSYSCKATTCGNYENTIHYGNYNTLVYGKIKTKNNESIDTFKDRNKRTVWWVPSIQN